MPSELVLGARCGRVRLGGCGRWQPERLPFGCPAIYGTFAQRKLPRPQEMLARDTGAFPSVTSCRATRGLPYRVGGSAPRTTAAGAVEQGSQSHCAVTTPRPGADARRWRVRRWLYPLDC